MKHVQIRKLKPVEEPFVRTATKEEYIPGQDNGLVSLPIDYIVKGHLVSDIVEGQSIHLVRCERNGIPVTGFFQTSHVKKIEGNLVYTENSVYEVTELELPEQFHSTLL